MTVCWGYFHPKFKFQPKHESHIRSNIRMSLYIKNINCILMHLFIVKKANMHWLFIKKNAGNPGTFNYVL